MWHPDAPEADALARRLLGRIAGALLLGAAMPGESSAAELPLRPVRPPGAATITELALLAEDAVTLVVAQAVAPFGRRVLAVPLAATGAGGAATPLASFLHAPAWAIGPRRQLVATGNGSATIALRWQAAGAAAQMVNRHNDTGAFDRPRFVRPDGRVPAAVTAVGLLGNLGTAAPVLFLPEADGGYGPFRLLPMPGPGVLLAVRLLRLRDGFALLTQAFVPGTPPRPQNASPDSEMIEGGVLDCVPLDAGLQPAGPAWQPFGDAPVYEFDADVADGGPVILATTADGLALASRAGVGAPRLVRSAVAVPLTSPAVAVQGGTLHLAALAGRETPQASVMLGRVGLPLP